MGFITFDALCRPVTQIPPGGDTSFAEDLTLAVSGAAGSALIVAARHGPKCQAVGGVGYVVTASMAALPPGCIWD